MKFHLVSVGNKMPEWVQTAFQTYHKRLPTHLPLFLHEIPLATRRKNMDVQQLMHKESATMLATIPLNCHVIALAIEGQAWSTETLASKLQSWQTLGQNICFLIGGPEGLTQDCLDRADKLWSLSALTLPHPLARVVLVEALYRASTLLSNHPYHRG